MEALKDDVKEALDAHVFRLIELNGEDRRKFIERVKRAKPHRKKGSFSFKAAMAGIAAAALLVLLAMPLADVFTNSGSIADIEKEANELFGHEILVPEFKNYPITFAALYNPKQAGHKVLSVNYALAKGEQDTRMSNKEDIQKWEKSNESHLLYGPYTGKPILRLTYNELKPTLEGATTRKVNGFDVQFNLLSGKPAGDFYHALIYTKEGSYYLEFFLSEGFTVENADEMIEELTMQLVE
ncbi:hypothetical protein [Bacillus sp. FJAT-27245]|uniref:hypothetical protein n=1 Tax=Bacillus sp. FJAT-27245 TaxID=1684144 RepID=UPI0006A7CF2B|nr:hypothetical protein [Bacillus sp. FJAT-27245]